jgi:phenylalanyl-tRNA synthetase beta chain
LDALQKLIGKVKRTKPVSKFPMVERDIAFVLPQETPAGEVIKLIQQVAGALLRRVEVFDVYQGGNIEEGSKSVAFRLLYQDLAGTLGETEILAVQGKVMAAVKEKFSASVR